MTQTRMYINPDYPCDTCVNEGSSICETCGTIRTPSGKITKPSRYKCRFGRKKYDIFKVPTHAKILVTAMIAGYRARQKAIDMKTVSDKVAATYENLNYCIDKAIESMEPGLRNIMLYDFEHRVGFKYSDACTFISANSYFRRKRRLIYDVAKMVNLI